MDLRHAPRTLLSLGAVNTSGTPLINQLAIWTDLDTVQGLAGLTFDGTTFVLTGDQTTSGFLALGATPASAGTLRMDNGASMRWRNGADTFDHTILNMDTDNLEIGSGVGQVDIFTSSAGLFTDVALSIGSSPAAAGTLRLPYAGTIAWRDAAGGADLSAIDFTGAAGSEILQLGFGDIFGVNLSATNGVGVISDFNVVGDQTLTGSLTTNDVVTLTPPASVAAEGLVNGDFTVFTGWTETGQFTQGAGVYAYLEAGGSTGTIIQATAGMAVPILANTLYELTYTISNVVQTVRLALEPPFVDSSLTLEDPITNGTKTVRFWSGAQAVNTGFILSGDGGATGDAFDIDDISLKRATETTVTVEGYIQGLQTGGLAGGFRIDDNGILILGQRRKDQSGIIADVMIIGPEAGTSSGFDTSGAIAFRAQHHDGASPVSSDWRIYNEPANNLGVSRYRWSNRIGEAAYAVKMQLFSDSNRLEINAEPGAQPTTDADTKLLIQNNLNVTDHCNFSIISGATSGESRIHFGDSADENEGVFLFRNATFDFSWTVGGTANALQLALAELTLESSMSLNWSTDVKLFRDGPWELALRDGLNDNFFYVYGTFTDSDNYERLAVYAGSPVNHIIESQTAGTGGDDINMIVRGAGTGQLTLGHTAGANVNIITANGVIFRVGPNQTGVSMSFHDANAEQTSMSGATVTFSNIIPANVIIQSVLVRVTTLITGATTFNIGDGSTADRWGNGIAVAQNTTTDVSDYTVDLGPFYSGAATSDVVLTGVGGSFTAGAVRVIVIYSIVQPPTS